MKLHYLPSWARFREAKHDFVKAVVEEEEESDGNNIKATAESKATSVLSFYYLWVIYHAGILSHFRFSYLHCSFDTLARDIYICSSHSK